MSVSSMLAWASLPPPAFNLYITCCSDCTTRTLHMPKPVKPFLSQIEVDVPSSWLDLTVVISRINTTSDDLRDLKSKKLHIFRYFSCYEQLIFCAQLLSMKKVLKPRARCFFFFERTLKKLGQGKLLYPTVNLEVIQ